jgi:hypothetical protein
MAQRAAADCLSPARLAMSCQYPVTGDTTMRAALPITMLFLSAGVAFAKLPPPTDAAIAAAAETKAKSDWTAKVDAYKLCQSVDKTAAYYRSHVPPGKTAPPAQPTPPCVDPGPYAATPVTPEASKPLEAAGAHSPAGTAVSPPSNKATAAEIAGGVKKQQ